MVAGEDDHGLGVADQLDRRPQGAAGPVGLGLDDGLDALGQARRRDRAAGRRSPRPCPAPAARAARIGQATIGRPQTGCSIFGSEERIRVPSPAARTRTRGELTPES